MTRAGPEDSFRLSRSRVTMRESVAAALITVAYATARLLPMVGLRTLTFSDTSDYFESSRSGLISGSLWAGRRPALYPLLAKLTDRSHFLLFLLQACSSTIAWLALAWLVYTRLRSRLLAPIAALVVLFASMSIEVVQWDRALLTESLTMSLAVSLLVLGVVFVERPSLARGVGVAAVALAWVLLRDSNGYVVLCVAVAFAVGGISSRARRRAFLSIVAALVLIFLVGAASSSIGRRWEGPLKDVITVRALTYSDRTSYLFAHGLPLTRAEASRVAGHCVVRSPPHRGCALLTDGRFFRWIRVDGRSTYSGWIVSHLGTAFADPIRHAGDMLGSRLPVAELSGYKFAPADLAERIFFVRNQAALLTESLVAVVLVLFALRRRASPLAWAALTGLASTYPHLFVVWTFGALEDDRHAIGASVILRVAITLAVVCAVDAAIVPSGTADA